MQTPVLPYLRHSFPSMSLLLIHVHRVQLDFLWFQPAQYLFRYRSRTENVWYEEPKSWAAMTMHIRIILLAIEVIVPNASPGFHRSLVCEFMICYLTNIACCNIKRNKLIYQVCFIIRCHCRAMVATSLVRYWSHIRRHNACSHGLFDHTTMLHTERGWFRCIGPLLASCEPALQDSISITRRCEWCCSVSCASELARPVSLSVSRAYIVQD